MTQELAEWLEDYVLKYTGLIFRILLHRVDGQATAEDLLQEVFCKVLKYAEQMSSFDDDHLRFYTRRIIYSVIADYYRDPERELAVETEIDFNEMEIEYNAYSNPENHIINQGYKDVIDRLPKKYSEVLLLHIFYGVPLKDIASRSGVKEATMRKRFERAKRRLLDKLNEKTS